MKFFVPLKRKAIADEVNDFTLSGYLDEIDMKSHETKYQRLEAQGA